MQLIVLDRDGVINKELKNFLNHLINKFSYMNC